MTSHVIAYRSLELLFGTHTFHFNCFFEDFNCVVTQIRCLSRVLCTTKARIFLLVDLQGIFSDLGSGDEKKALKMTSCAFFISRKKHTKTSSKVNQHHFTENLVRKITFNSVTLKNTQTEHKFFFFNETMF